MNHVYNATNEIKVSIDGKTQAQIRDEIIAAGGNIGKTSLRDLLAGERANVCGYELLELDVETPAAANLSAPTEQAAPAPAPVVVVPTVITPADLAPVVDKAAQTKSAAWAASFAPVAAASTIKPIRKGTKRSKVFELLANPTTGMSIAELMKTTGESETSVKVIISQKAKKKGYTVVKEEVAERGTVYFLAIGDTKIDTTGIVYAEKGEEVAE